MLVRLDLSPDSDIKVIEDEEGNPISIEFTPMFASRQGSAVLAYGVCLKEDGKGQLDRFSLIVSGKTGKIAKKERSRAVKALADEPHTALPVAETKPTPPATKPERGTKVNP